jgi:hypothetical protein
VTLTCKRMQMMIIIGMQSIFNACNLLIFACYIHFIVVCRFPGEDYYQPAMPLFKPTRVPASFVSDVMKRDSQTFDENQSPPKSSRVSLQMSNVFREMESKLSPLISTHAPRRQMVSVLAELQKVRGVEHEEEGGGGGGGGGGGLNAIIETNDGDTKELDEIDNVAQVSESSASPPKNETEEVLSQAILPTHAQVLTTRPVSSMRRPGLAKGSLGQIQVSFTDSELSSSRAAQSGRLRPSLMRSGSKDDNKTSAQVRRSFADAVMSRSPVTASMMNGIQRLPAFEKHSIDHIVTSLASTIMGEIRAGFNLLKDLATHSVANPYQIVEMYPRMPWHDVHGCVAGTVAKDMAAHFVEVSCM